MGERRSDEDLGDVELPGGQAERAAEAVELAEQDPGQ